MVGLQMGRRVLAAVMAALMVTPPRGAGAQGQSREDQAGGQREGGLPGRSSSMIWARNETEFAQALQSGADETWVPMFDPRTRVTLTRTITVRRGGPWMKPFRGGHVAPQEPFRPWERIFSGGLM